MELFLRAAVVDVESIKDLVVTLVRRVEITCIAVIFEHDSVTRSRERERVCSCATKLESMSDGRAGWNRFWREEIQDLHFGRPTSLRFTGANRDMQKYRARKATTQRFASGATAQLAGQPTTPAANSSNVPIPNSRSR